MRVILLTALLLIAGVVTQQPWTVFSQTYDAIFSSEGINWPGGKHERGILAFRLSQNMNPIRSMLM